MNPFKFSALVVCSSLFFGALFAQTENAFVDASDNELSLTNDIEKIYIQQAKSALLTSNPNKLGSYLLTISGSDKTLVYFSDKPNREAGTLTLSQFVKQWINNPSLQETPPNVVISFVDFKPSSSKGVGADILQLSSPSYNYSEDKITFEATPLHEFEVMTGKFENVVMVFDGLYSGELEN